MTNLTSVYTQIRALHLTPTGLTVRIRNACQDAVPVYTGCFNLFRVCPKTEGYTDESQQQFSASAPPASLSLLGNFEVYLTKHTKNNGIIILPEVFLLFLMMYFY